MELNDSINNYIYAATKQAACVSLYTLAKLQVALICFAFEKKLLQIYEKHKRCTSFVYLYIFYGYFMGILLQQRMILV